MIHNLIFIKYDSWFMVHNLRFIIYDSYFMIHHLRFIIYDSWFKIHNLWFIIYGSQLLIHSSWFIIYDSQFMFHNLWFITHDSWFMNHSLWFTTWPPKTHIGLKRFEIRDLELSLGVPGAKFRCASFMFSPIWTNIGARRRFRLISDDIFCQKSSKSIWTDSP